jgi:hypothetical protein
MRPAIKLTLIKAGMFLSIQSISAQTLERINRGKIQFQKIIELVRNNDIIQLADLVQYPLERPDPVPNIDTKGSFVLYYSTLFDDRFRKMLLDTAQSLSSTFADPHTFYVGLFQGEIYINDDGLINRINYSSLKELELQQTLNKETLSLMHPSIKKWKTNVLVCKSDNFLIRVDLMENNTLRYISWSSPKKISDKSDLILFDGIQDFHGTMGGVSYSFKSGDWTYVVDYVAMCEDDDKWIFFKTSSKRPGKENDPNYKK